MDILSIERTILLLPHMLGYRPRQAIGIVALNCQPGVFLDTAIGPVLLWDLTRGEIGEKFTKAIRAFANDMKADHVAMVWYGNQPFDRNTMSHTEKALLETTSCLESLDHVNVALLYTDYADVTQLHAWYNSRGSDFSFPFHELEKEEGFDTLYSGFWEVPLLAAENLARFDCERREKILIRYRNYVAKGRTNFAEEWDAALAHIESTPANPYGLLPSIHRDTVWVWARLLAYLTNPYQRDAILLWALDPSVERVSVLGRQATRERLRELSEQRPPLERITLLSHLLTMLARYSGDDDARPYAMLAYLAWWSGDGRRGALYSDLAWESDPQYPLAALLHRAYSAVLPPPWVISAEERLDEAEGEAMRTQGV